MLLNSGSTFFFRITEIRYKAGPRLLDLASWAPLAMGANSRNLVPTL